MGKKGDGLTSPPTEILSAAGVSPKDVRYLLIYGSSILKHSGARRDIDALLVARGVKPSYVSAALHNSMLHLHIVSPSVIRNDLLSDKYGWMFLTKLLGPFRVELGSAAEAERDKAYAHLRILGQWFAELSITALSGQVLPSNALTDVLSRWNPQFLAYCIDGRIALEEHRKYITEYLCDRPEARQLLSSRPDGRLHVRKRSPFLRRADLRTVLIRYWCLYVAYKLSPESYLDQSLLDLLEFKRALG